MSGGGYSAAGAIGGAVAKWSGADRPLSAGDNHREWAAATLPSALVRRPQTRTIGRHWPVRWWARTQIRPPPAYVDRFPNGAARPPVGQIIDWRQFVCRLERLPDRERANLAGCGSWPSWPLSAGGIFSAARIAARPSTRTPRPIRVVRLDDDHGQLGRGPFLRETRQSDRWHYRPSVRLPRQQTSWRPESGAPTAVR